MAAQARPGQPRVRQLQGERWRRIAEIIGPRFRGIAPLRVVDVGCGKGGDLAQIAELLPDATLFGVDLSEERIEAARLAVPTATLRVQEGDILPFPDRSAQLVVLSTVLSSVLDPGTRRQVAAESYRIVSDDGHRLARRPTASPAAVACCSSMTSCRYRRWPGARAGEGRACTSRWPASGPSAAATCRW